METTIQKWGNSLALRIPKILALDAHIKEGSRVEIVAADEKIMIEPIRKPVLDLKTLVSRITSENIHSEVDTGGRMGREAW
ncbi:MAG: AbrB/MazE/SpoVT family DNA-binding domain-containing protein [Candidatus Auribacterota bacterium]|nr:AbrB/MazE/SpoVT family DNA-binding domain-containing protein [Candidatus Auribacterota bacterium]